MQSYKLICHVIQIAAWRKAVFNRVADIYRNDQPSFQALRRVHHGLFAILPNFSAMLEDTRNAQLENREDFYPVGDASTDLSPLYRAEGIDPNTLRRALVQAVAQQPSLLKVSPPSVIVSQKVEPAAVEDVGGVVDLNRSTTSQAAAPTTVTMDSLLITHPH